MPEISREQLVDALQGFHLWVTPDPDYKQGRLSAACVVGTVQDPESMADGLLLALRANAAHAADGDSEPETPPCTVTFDLTDPGALHVLTQALEDYAAHGRAMASLDDASESFTRWADLADEMRALAEAAGS
jgi:hypothetical protein